MRLRAVSGPTCSCRHGLEAHQHYRPASDCALCGCEHFHRPLTGRLWHRAH